MATVGLDADRVRSLGLSPSDLLIEAMWLGVRLIPLRGVDLERIGAAAPGTPSVPVREAGVNWHCIRQLAGT
jgi:hypothetical protein